MAAETTAALSPVTFALLPAMILTASPLRGRRTLDAADI
jgi:hypothetical protein